MVKLKAFARTLEQLSHAPNEDGVARMLGFMDVFLQFIPYTGEPEWKNCKLMPHLNRILSTRQFTADPMIVLCVFEAIGWTLRYNMDNEIEDCDYLVHIMPFHLKRAGDDLDLIDTIFFAFAPYAARMSDAQIEKLVELEFVQITCRILAKYKEKNTIFDMVQVLICLHPFAQNKKGAEILVQNGQYNYVIHMS